MRNSSIERSVTNRTTPVRRELYPTTVYDVRMNYVPPPQTNTMLDTLSALIAIVVVTLQNRSASQRNVRELQHDAEQRRLEREAELRKLVYLEALQEFAQVSKVLRGIAD